MQNLIKNEKRIDKSYFYHRDVIKFSVFAAEDVAEGIADEAGIANH